MLFSRPSLPLRFIKTAFDLFFFTCLVSIVVFSIGSFIYAPTNAVFGETSPSTLSVLDDDDPPLVNFDASAYAVDERAGSARITVTLDTASGQDVDVDYASADGTAVAGEDYTAVSNTLTISPGQISATFTVPITRDFQSEDSETVFLTLSNPMNADLGDPFTATLTITDAGPATVYLPLVQSPPPPGPDLIVQSITVSRHNATVVIENIGEAAVNDAFWIDLYIDPDPIPTAVNQTWEQLADEGLVWGITDISALTPGGTFTVDLNHENYRPALSQFSGTFRNGMEIYVQVDSTHKLTDYGGVLETHEYTNGYYNNISHITVQLSPGAGKQTAVTTLPAPTLFDPEGLPLRP